MLSARQRKAAELLANGFKHHEAGEAVGVHRVSVSRWCSDEEFMEEVRRLAPKNSRYHKKEERDEEIRKQQQLNNITTQAIQIIDDAIYDETLDIKERLSIAFKILEIQALLDKK